MVAPKYKHCTRCGCAYIYFVKYFKCDELCPSCSRLGDGKKYNHDYYKKVKKVSRDIS